VTPPSRRDAISPALSHPRDLKTFRFQHGADFSGLVALDFNGAPFHRSAATASGADFPGDGFDD